MGPGAKTDREVSEEFLREDPYERAYREQLEELSRWVDDAFDRIIIGEEVKDGSGEEDAGADRVPARVI